MRMASGDEQRLPSSDETHGGAARKQQSQLDFDIGFFDRVLARNPADVSVLRRQAEALARKGEYVRALELDRRLVSIMPQDCVARYNLACSLALGECRVEAINQLRQALEQGYDDFEYLAHDTDLKNLHGEPAYQKLLREFGVVQTAP
jgi:predicted Zn-dependent protease